MQSTMEECVLFLGHSFVRRMKEACGRGAMCGVQHRYYTRDLCLSDIYVWEGRFARERWAYCGWPFLGTGSCAVVMIVIGTNDLSNKNCVPEDLVDRIVAFARELLTISPIAQVVVCEIVTRVPVRFRRCEVRPDFERVRQIANDKMYASITDLHNITYWHHRGEMFCERWCAHECSWHA
ncbi:hypothetical protein NP493_4g14041 [Ridgeia piscesae]|uniref:Uncharacterized protein n=1 Tax=Ridgeia piscesae TaxID=27915 RepID=A0AAD9ULP6_RIDPI|nr:hypothetical protein NP493_4g14041 [Ridgeia piscesae]